MTIPATEYDALCDLMRGLIEAAGWDDIDLGYRLSAAGFGDDEIRFAQLIRAGAQSRELLETP